MTTSQRAAIFAEGKFVKITPECKPEVGEKYVRRNGDKAFCLKWDRVNEKYYNLASEYYWFPMPEMP